MSKRSLADELVQPDTEAEETRLGRELSERQDDQFFYQLPGWQHFEELLELLQERNSTELAREGVTPARTEFLRGRLDILQALLRLEFDNEVAINRIATRFTELETLQEEDNDDG